MLTPSVTSEPVFLEVQPLWRTRCSTGTLQAFDASPTGPAEVPSLMGQAIPHFSAFRVWWRAPFLWGKQTKTVPKSHREVTFVTFSLWWDYATFSNKAAASKLWNQWQWEDSGQPALEAQAYCGDRRSSKSLLQEREALASHKPTIVPSHLSLEQLFLNFGPEEWGSSVCQRSSWPMLEGSRLEKKGSLQHRLVLTSLPQQRWQHCNPLNPWCLCSDMKDINHRQLLIVILEKGGINRFLPIESFN